MQLMEIAQQDIKNAENLLAIIDKGTFEVKGDSFALISEVIAAHANLALRIKKAFQSKEHSGLVPYAPQEYKDDATRIREAVVVLKDHAGTKLLEEIAGKELIKLCDSLCEVDRTLHWLDKEINKIKSKPKSKRSKA
jgi:hypothetical protein